MPHRSPALVFLSALSFAVCAGPSVSSISARSQKQNLKPAAVPSATKLCPGFRAEMDVNMVIGNIRTTSGTSRYAVLKSKARDARGREVFVADLSLDADYGKIQRNTRLYFSFDLSGSRRIHGFRISQGEDIWFSALPEAALAELASDTYFDRAEAVYREMPATFAPGKKFRTFDVAMCEGPGMVELTVKRRDTLVVGADEIDAFVCEGSIVTDVPGNAVIGAGKAATAYRIWITPGHEVVKIVQEVVCTWEKAPAPGMILNTFVVRR